MKIVSFAFALWCAFLRPLRAKTRPSTVSVAVLDSGDIVIDNDGTVSSTGRRRKKSEKHSFKDFSSTDSGRRQEGARCPLEIFRSFSRVKMTAADRGQEKERGPRGEAGEIAEAPHSSASSSSEDRYLSTSTVLFLTLLKDESNFGKHRKLEDFFELIASQNHPPDRISVGILVSEPGAFQAMRRRFCSLIRLHGFASGTLIHRDGRVNGLSRLNRTDRELQTARRQLLASLRNFLLSSALDKEDFVFWLDGDIVRLDDNALSFLLRAATQTNNETNTSTGQLKSHHGEASQEDERKRPRVQSAASILMLNTAMEGDLGANSYDMNAWYGRRKAPPSFFENAAARLHSFFKAPFSISLSSSVRRKESNAKGTIERKKESLLAPRQSPEEAHGQSESTFEEERWTPGCDECWTLSDLAPACVSTGADLTSTERGSCGQQTTSSEQIGRDHDGFDGIETEGFCFVARFLGHECWGAFRVHAWHFRDRPLGQGPEAWHRGGVAKTCPVGEGDLKRVWGLDKNGEGERGVGGEDKRTKKGREYKSEIGGNSGNTKGQEHLARGGTEKGQEEASQEKGQEEASQPEKAKEKEKARLQEELEFGSGDWRESNRLDLDSSWEAKIKF
uniref:Nucleotide-diphospho-sugar transferase domain-containing protein n=1 Tax=Chromera velia CCMP2878 TaxID=1169474 RepID=A0A0G4FRI2_9ALVE|eukprot:Cvel_18399.t1-p1 / transcript=Cvel_18399.t1 / gene=Cvel_18399 / organism=Chromera_velia_CCMP2878 / gene_product=hypothetical protein / transcript_product=hypothetical protein / location=Cvel_scaffold1521:22774-26824(+) / protein_length=619 / sequence_SO=supercontig / SO=protein_coding / is_pseudo=false